MRPWLSIALVLVTFRSVGAQEAPPFLQHLEDRPSPAALPAEAPENWLLSFVDVETTGLLPGYHEMIDIGMILTDLQGREVDRLFIRLPARASGAHFRGRPRGKRVQSRTLGRARRAFAEGRGRAHRLLSPGGREGARRPSRRLQRALRCRVHRPPVSRSGTHVEGALPLFHPRHSFDGLESGARDLDGIRPHEIARHRGRTACRRGSHRCHRCRRQRAGSTARSSSARAGVDTRLVSVVRLRY